MSVNIKMSRYNMCVSIDLSNSDTGYDVNTSGFLSTIEEFLRTLELYENVNVEIKKRSVSDSDDELFNFYPDDGITVTSYGGGDVSFSNMNDTIVLDPKL